MNPITVYKDHCLNATVIANQFIDEYMAAANHAQIKIYLYLVRMTGANLAFTVSDIADKFNLTEKDVMRALRYWEKLRLLSLDYDSEQSLKGIHILPFPVITQGAEIVPLTPKTAVQPVPAVQPAPVKKQFRADELTAFQSNSETSQIIFVAEQYMGRPLSRSDLDTLLFIYNTLGFSCDLIDYLIQYCVGRGKKQFSYMEKVAIDWSQSHITTVRQAKLRTTKYDKQVYGIMRALGKSAEPTEPEVAYINSWLKELGFSADVIHKACERAVLATDHNRIQYANAVLQKWHEARVRTLKDVEALDTAYQKTASPPHKSGGFNDFSQRTYDYDALEKALLEN